MFAAGQGRRLFGGDDSQPPKCLLRFGGETLLQRHIRILKKFGLSELVMVVGYRAHDIRAHVLDIGAKNFVRFIDNPRFKQGSVLSLSKASEVLRSGNPILCMDADVLYDPLIIDRILAIGNRTVFPYDSEFDQGDEPVKLCLNRSKPVEFRKEPDDIPYEVVGEWVGFMRLEPDFAKALAEQSIRDSATVMDMPYEDSVRAVLRNGWARKTTAIDINGLAWIEIDFPEDVELARTDILEKV
tara:strand:+ start:6249 stop:6974 length:726 start_codon:yes stop_codon:yes gene_type:complete